MICFASFRIPITGFILLREKYQKTNRSIYTRIKCFTIHVWVVNIFPDESMQIMKSDRVSVTTGRLRARSHCAILLIATNGLYWNQWKYSHYATATTSPAPIQPIVSKTNRSLIATNGLYRTQWKCSHCATATTSPTPIHYKHKQIAVAITKTHSVSEPLVLLKMQYCLPTFRGK